MKKVLILTSSGGGGILRVADAKEQQIRARYPNAKIIRIDVMREWVFWPLNKFCVWAWNQSQRSGFVLFLKFFGYVQFLADYLFWFSIFHKAFKVIFKEDVDHIIDTQPLCPSAIIKVIRMFHKLKKKRITLEKVMSDLPTKECTHFFANIKKMSKKDKEYLRFVSNYPLLEGEKNYEEFWQKYCKISESYVTYDSLLIREEFIKLIGKKRESFSKISVRVKNEAEKILLAKILPNDVKWNEQDNSFEFCVESEDKLVTILLGSQPSYSGTYNYVKCFIDVLKELKCKRRFFIFAYAIDVDNKLYKSICDLISKEKNSSNNWCLIPMSYQPADVIASLFFRSDLTITKSAGQTAMELMALCKGRCFIHSEVNADKDELSLQELLSGIPVWEAGGALYLKEKFNATLVAPHTFKKELITFIQEGSNA